MRPRSAARELLLYGVAGGLLIAILQLVEYRYSIQAWSPSVYGGIVAVVFSAVGIGLGLKVRKTRVEEKIVVQEVRVPADSPFALNAASLDRLGITPRELEILGLIAAGLSNREIADKLFVSENTVKTHSSRLFDKLNVKRRTQAVQVGKEQGLLP